jgi:hypothetical protein
MFTWICPQCGREVPPSYTECPDCAARAAKTGAAPEQPQPPAAVPSTPPPSAYAPPAAAPPYQPAAYQQPQYAQSPPVAVPYPPRRGATVPTWLMAILFGLAFVGLGVGIYWTVNHFRGGASAAPSATVESPAAKPGAKTSPLQKYIEIAGVRFVPDPKKKETTLVKFLLVNHSDADLTGLAGNVTVWGRTQKSEEDAVGTFSFTTNVAPQESKEMTAPLVTKLKIYELPDWQNVTTDVQITAPQ